MVWYGMVWYGGFGDMGWLVRDGLVSGMAWCTLIKQTKQSYQCSMHEM